MNARGFTVIEILAITVLLAIFGAVFWTQKNNIEVANRDEKRKISINAMYYGLEKVFYPANGYYPKNFSETTLPSVDKNLFKDPSGVKLGATDSDYRYEPKGCIDNRCTEYTLRATLENEADYVKTSDRSNEDAS